MLSLADAIIHGDLDSVRAVLRYGEDVNQIDEYGFTPLIEAAIMNNILISQLLLGQGANANMQDLTGGTPLYWAADNNNLELAEILLKAHADPNAYNLAGQPVLAMSLLRRQKEMKALLVKYGADLVFAQDFINTKLLGHMFELVGSAEIIDPHNQFVEVDFEGFFLEVTIGIIADSLLQFQNHFAARQLRRFSGIAQFIVDVMQRAAKLIKYNHYLVDVKKHSRVIDSFIQQEPLLIPVGYEGHAITFIKYGPYWVKCDRREDSRLYDNIVIYRITHLEQASPAFIKLLLYQKQSSEFINQELDQILGLQLVTELKVEAQISGNCSWANVEAAIPAIFFLVLMQMNQEKKAIAYYKTLALNFFHRWREWNKERALHFCIQSYQEGDAIRKATKAEILAAILFERCDLENASDREHIDIILGLLLKSPYEYILKNYLRVYYYENYTEEGKRFADLLKAYGYSLK